MTFFRTEMVIFHQIFNTVDRDTYKYILVVYYITINLQYKIWSYTTGFIFCCSNKIVLFFSYIKKPETALIILSFFYYILVFSLVHSSAFIHYIGDITIIWYIDYWHLLLTRCGDMDDTYIVPIPYYIVLYFLKIDINYPFNYLN